MFASIAKQNIVNSLDLIAQDSRLFLKLKHLSLYWPLMNVEEKKVVDECVRLFTPNQTVTDILSDDEQLSRWGKAIDSFKIKSNKKGDNILAKVILEENLHQLRKELTKSGVFNFIDEALSASGSSTSLHNLVNSPSSLTSLFVTDNQVNENFKVLAEFYLKSFNKRNSIKKDEQIVDFVNPLHPEEAEAYARVLLALCGVEGLTNTNTAQPFLSAYAKMHSDFDELRCLKLFDIKNIIAEIKIGGIYQFSSYNGFDDILLCELIGSSLRYFLQIIEQKVRKDRFFTLLNKKSSDFTRLVIENVETLVGKMTEEMRTSGINKETIVSLTKELRNKYTLVTTGIGLDFLKKVKANNLRDSLIKAGLSSEIINEILKGAIIQNQFISLLQNGCSYKMIKKDGFWTVTDEIVQEMNVMVYVDSLGCQVEVKIERDAFIPHFINNNGVPILTVKGFNLQKVRDNPKTYLGYNYLNRLLENALKKYGLYNLNISNLSYTQILTKLNTIQQVIYNTFVNRVYGAQTYLFDELSIFYGGRIHFALETLSNRCDSVIVKLQSYFKRKAIVPYDSHQHWLTPFYLRGVFKPLSIGVSVNFKEEPWNYIKNRYFKDALITEKCTVKNVKHILKHFIVDPLWIQKIIRDLQPPFTLPTGYHLNIKGSRGNSSILRGIVFFDRSINKPITMPNNGPIIGILSNLDEFWNSHPFTNKYLFQFPIRVKSKADRGIVLELSSNLDLVNAWKKRLIHAGIPRSDVLILKPFYDLAARNASERIKLFCAIIFEYKEIWEEFASWITKRITTLILKAKENPAVIASELSAGVDPVYFVSRFSCNKSGQWFFLDDTGKKIPVSLGLCGLDSRRCIKDISRSFYFPNNNSLFLAIVSDISDQLLKFVFNKTDKVNMNEVYNYLVLYWATC